jgi:hypothetical protein
MWNMLPLPPFNFKNLWQSVGALANTPPYRLAQLEEHFAQLDAGCSGIQDGVTGPVQSNVGTLKVDIDSFESM